MVPKTITTVRSNITDHTIISVTTTTTTTIIIIMFEILRGLPKYDTET